MDAGGRGTHDYMKVVGREKQDARAKEKLLSVP
jgi:hypothetical protein